MSIDAEAKYKLEYAEIGHLRRHYSTVRATLTTFSLGGSAAACLSYLSNEQDHWFMGVASFLMLIVALIMCFIFSYRCETANLYAELLWSWFDGKTKDAPPQYLQFHPSLKEVYPGMYRDEMNRMMVVVAALGCIAFIAFIVALILK